MTKRINLSSSSILLLAYISIFCLLVLLSVSAGAQDITAEDQCYNKKLKATGSHVRCVIKAQVRANRNNTTVSQEALDRCNERFERRINKAEADAADKNALCPSHGDTVPTDQTNLDTANTINTASNIKTLTINIAENDLQFLNDRDFNLNIAIKVNGDFSVIWRSVSEYSSINTFQWSPVFHILGSSEIDDSPKVDISTNAVDIILGQDVLFNSSKLIEQPVTGNSPNGINFINNSGSIINPVLAQLLTFVQSSDTTQAITPIFISDKPLLSGESLLITPSQEVMVWFGDAVDPGSLFTGTGSLTDLGVDLSEDSSAAYLYSDGIWSNISEN